MDGISPFRTLMIFAALCLVGFSIAPLLPLQYLPEGRVPALRVSFQWPEAEPDIVERQVTAPLEAAFSLEPGIERIYSVSSFGGGTIRLDLDDNADAALVRSSVAMRIRHLYKELPEGVRYPVVEPLRRGSREEDQPLHIWSLSGPDGPVELQRYALEILAPLLTLTPGAGHITVEGGNDMEWVLYYDATQLQQVGLQAEDLVESVSRSFRQEPLGVIRQGSFLRHVYLGQQAGDSPEHIRRRLLEKPVGKIGQTILRLGQVATLQYAERKPQSYYRINGQSGVRLLIFPEKGTNTLKVSAALREQILQLSDMLPQGYALTLDHDEAEYVRAELEKIKQRTLWSLGILLIFVLVAYRDIRQLTAVVLSLLATLGLAFAGFYAFGVQLHLYALAGITVSFGIVIDNSIVMVHHLRQRAGHSVFPALLASTLTTVAALAVLWWLPEEWRINLSDFGSVLAITLTSSLIVARWFTPAVVQQLGILSKNNAPTASLPRSMKKFHRFYLSGLSVMLQYRKSFIIAIVLLFGTPVFMLPDEVKGWEWYNKTLGSEWYVEHAKPLVNKALGGTLRLFAWYVWEGSSFREPEATRLFVQAKMPPGATPKQMNDVFEVVEKYLASYESGIDKFVSTINGPEYAEIVITFSKDADPAFPYILKNRLIAFSLNFGGMKWNIYGVGRGFSNEGSTSSPVYEVKMTGYNRDQLRIYANRLAEKLTAHPRIPEVNVEANINWWEKDRYLFELRLDHEKLTIRKVQPASLRHLFERFNRASTPHQYLPNGTPLRLVSLQSQTNDLWKLNHEVQPLDSTQVFFPEIGSIEKHKAPLAIHRENQQYLQLLRFSYTGSYRFGSRYLSEKLEEMKKEMLPGYTAEEVLWSRQQKPGRQYGILALVASLIFFICALTFESLKQPFVIILSIPLSFVGIFLTFYWFDFPFDQGGYTSFLMVSGLAVNGLILVVNEFNGLHKEHPGVSEAELFLAALDRKIVPVVLSVLSTVLGLLPFTMHGQEEVFWFSLAVGTMGGLLFSLPVLVFMVPVLLCRKGSPRSDSVLGGGEPDSPWQNDTTDA